MILCRTAEQCGQADYGWLQARYTFSFGHYFDPELLGFASLRVLNQEVLQPGASFQPRTYPQVDVLNILLQGEAEYRDSNGNHTRAKAGDVLLLAAQPNVSYSERSISDDTPLTRLQLWFNACPSRENSALQRLSLCDSPVKLLASPEGESGSLQLRQQVWVHHVQLECNEQHTFALQGNRAYFQVIHGAMEASSPQDGTTRLQCGDGAFIQQEKQLTISAKAPLRALLIDLVA